MVLERLRGKLTRYDFASLLLTIVLLVLAIYISIELGLSLDKVLPFSGVFIVALLVAFFTSKNFFSKLVWSDIRYFVEISDDYNMHRLIAVSGSVFDKLRLTRPIIISFGNLIYCDEFDEDRLVVTPTWVHHKIQFLRDKNALSILKKEYEELEKEYSKLRAISDTLAIIKARRRLEEIEKLKRKILEGEIE